MYDPASGHRLADLFGIDDPDFRGGARAALAVLDGALALVVAAGNGGGPRVFVLDGRRRSSAG